MNPIAARPLLASTVVILASLALVSCKSAYYGTWSKLGWEKRDLLVSAVKKARNEQVEAREEFRDALEKFQSVVGTTGGPLQNKYDQLRDQYDDSAAAAKDVNQRIKDVEGVANDLFKEWENELDQYKSRELRRNSERQLRQTRRRYDELLDAMHRAEDKMEPVLTALHDQVLFLKHNLNAQAIASLQGTALNIEQDVERLIQEMEAAIREADEFIKQMGAEQKAE